MMTWDFPISAVTAAKSRHPILTDWPPTACAIRNFTTPRAAVRRAPPCCTGLHPHQTGIGILTYSNGPEGYAGNLNRSCVTVAEVLKQNNYKTYLSGKWHISSSLDRADRCMAACSAASTTFFGTIIGAGSFYHPEYATSRQRQYRARGRERSFRSFYTDAISDQAVAYIRQHKQANPRHTFFSYVAYRRHTGRCMRMTRILPNTREVRRGLGQTTRATAATASSTTASFIRTGN
jgi:hypothetical protein